MKESFSIWRNAVFFIFVLCLAFTSPAVPLQLVSAVDPSATPPAGGGGDSWHPIITPDGRYVLFASRANNLVLSGTNTPFVNQVPPKMNVFLRDRINGTTTLLSINLSGTGGGNGDSIPIELSTNGQYALFESAASDLAPHDTNNATDIFLRDLLNGTNHLVSVSTNGGFGNGSSWESVMTPDGRYVAFASAASNLVSNDTNGIQDIFVRDTQAGVTMLASPGATAASSSSSSSDSPEITPDGRYVAFRSTATNVVYSNATNVNEIYVRDLVSNTTTLASTNAHNLFTGTPNSYNQVISDDGQFVAFESSSSSAVGVIQRCNLQTGFTDIIYTNAVATYAYNHFRSVDMTPDGRFVTFVGSTNISGTTSCVFVWDAQTGVATLVNTNLNGDVPTNSVCDYPTIDPTGRWLTYFCTATNLTTNVVTGDFHLYVQDLQAGTITLVDASTNGAGSAKDLLSAPRLTPDGRFVAFDCSDTDLVPNDNNNAYDVFVSDLTGGTTELISVRQPTLPTQTPGGATFGSVFSVSTEGRYIAFSGTGDGLLATGYTNAYRGVFVRDQLDGTNILVSVDTNGLGGADDWSFDPSMSSDGRYIAFTSDADNLVTGSNTLGIQNICVRDLQTGTTTIVSVNASGTGPGNGNSYSPVISANGQYVLFLSRASNLTLPSSALAIPNLFARDLQSGTTYALTHFTSSTLNLLASMTPDGHFVAFGGQTANFYVWDSQAAAMIYTNNTSLISNIAISPDGNRIAYSMNAGFYVTDRAANTNWLIAPPLLSLHAGVQFSGDTRFLVYSTTNAQVALDTNGVADVYLYDFQTQNNLLVSRRLNSSGAANGSSDYPTISPDARFVAYRSTATNIVSGATNGLPNVFVYDRQTGNTTLLSVNYSGTAGGNNRSLPPMFSVDSQTVAFQSWASDLTAQDFNQVNDLFAVKIATSNPTPVFVGQVVFAPASLQSPTLTWPATSGKSYQVQFKDDLTDAVWQSLNGNVWVDGNLGYATDLAPNASQRFYRIAAF
jgi:hypothetical protein